jgi:hypothetical protein
MNIEQFDSQILGRSITNTSSTPCSLIDLGSSCRHFVNSLEREYKITSILRLELLIALIYNDDRRKALLLFSVIARTSSAISSSITITSLDKGGGYYRLQGKQQLVLSQQNAVANDVAALPRSFAGAFPSW